VKHSQPLQHQVESREVWLWFIHMVILVEEWCMPAWLHIRFIFIREFLWAIKYPVDWMSFCLIKW